MSPAPPVPPSPPVPHCPAFAQAGELEKEALLSGCPSPPRIGDSATVRGESEPAARGFRSAPLFSSSELDGATQRNATDISAGAYVVLLAQGALQRCRKGDHPGWVRAPGLSVVSPQARSLPGQAVSVGTSGERGRHAGESSVRPEKTGLERRKTGTADSRMTGAGGPSPASQPSVTSISCSTGEAPCDIAAERHGVAFTAGAADGPLSHLSIGTVVASRVMGRAGEEVFPPLGWQQRTHTQRLHTKEFPSWNGSFRSSSSLRSP